MSSHLHDEWRGEVQIGELTAIGKVSNPGSSYGAQACLIWVMKVVDDVSYIVARMFWSNK